MAAANNVIHSGYMQKKGDWGRFSRRYFELKMTPLPVLFMYEESSRKLKHKLNCNTVSQIIRSDYQTIVLHFEKKKWHLYCEHKEVADEWEKALRRFDEDHYQASMVEYQLQMVCLHTYLRISATATHHPPLISAARTDWARRLDRLRL